MEVLRLPARSPDAAEAAPGPVQLQSPAVVTERVTARAATAIVAFDVVAFGACVVVVVHPRARLGRVIRRDFGHCRLHL